MFGSSCRRPSYGRMVGSDLVAGLVTAVSVGAGALGGWYIGKNQDEQNPQAGAVKGALLGGVAGGLIGFYPSMLAQRAVLRDPSCMDPSMWRIFGYRVASNAAMALVGFGLREVMPDKCEAVNVPGPVPAPDGGTMVGSLGIMEKCRPNFGRHAIAGAVGVLGMPLLGMQIVKEEHDD